MSERLRALFVNDTARNGGPGRTLYCTLKYLDPAQVHRAVVLPRPGVVSELLTAGAVADDLAYEPRIIENPVAPLRRPMVRTDYDAPLPLRVLRGISNVGLGAAGVLALAGRVRRGAYDVVFCNGTTANFLGGAMAVLTGVPVIWHVFYPEVARALVPLHEALASQGRVASILCVSGAVATQFQKAPRAAGKVKIIHDAIDVDEYAPPAAASRGGPSPLDAELHLPGDAVVFGSQGRILRRKGYVEMIQGAARALRELTESERRRATFVILGDTPEDLRPDHLAECRALVAQQGLADKVHFLGYRPDVKPYLARFDVVVVPSVYADPLPRSVLEAMAFRKPVVAFDAGGIGEMVQHDVTGLLAPLRGRGTPSPGQDPGQGPDVDGLAAHFVRYLRDDALRAAHGAAARARVVEHFDARVHARVVQAELFAAAGKGLTRGEPSEGTRAS